MKIHSFQSNFKLIIHSLLNSKPKALFLSMKLIKFLPVDRQKKLFNQFCEREEQDQLTL